MTHFLDSTPFSASNPRPFRQGMDHCDRADNVLTKTVSPLAMTLDEYTHWKEQRLKQARTRSFEIIQLRCPDKLTPLEKQSILTSITACNFAIYQYDNERYPLGYQQICQQLGLNNRISNPGADANQVTDIRDYKGQHPGSQKTRYIPYSNAPLGWHTDGYYHSDHHNNEALIRSFILHCDAPAVSGGENQLIDPEMLYIQLRELNPQWAQALCKHNTLTIPENIVDGHQVRPSFSGPVFSTDPISGKLYTRFTQRKRHIHWQQDNDTQRALEAIDNLLSGQNEFVFTLLLHSGQGVVSNNVLHRRNGFVDSVEHSQQASARCLKRIRFSDYIVASAPQNHINNRSL